MTEKSPDENPRKVQASDHDGKFQPMALVQLIASLDFLKNAIVLRDPSAEMELHQFSALHNQSGPYKQQQHLPQTAGSGLDPTRKSSLPHSQRRPKAWIH